MTYCRCPAAQILPAAQGSAEFATASITVADTPFTVTGERIAVFTDSTGGPITILLPPAPAAGNEVIVKDSGGDAANNNITVDGNGNTIDGEPTSPIGTNYQAMWYMFNGSEWSVL